MSSLSELKRFLYVAPNMVAMSDLSLNNELLRRTNTLVRELINSGKGNDLLAEVVTYCKLYSASYQKLDAFSDRIQFNLDSVTFVLASCSLVKKDELFTHKVYTTLSELATTPVHLFAFEYYRKYLMGVELNADSAKPEESVQSAVVSPDKTRRFGRGQTKFLSRWYNQSDERHMLRLLTQFKHGYAWSNKDLLKLIHMKPKTEGFFVE